MTEKCKEQVACRFKRFRDRLAAPFPFKGVCQRYVVNDQRIILLGVSCSFFHLYELESDTISFFFSHCGARVE